MRYIILILNTVIFTSVVFAEQTLREIKWSDQKLTTGEVIEPNIDCNFTQLRVQNAQNEKKTFAILTISDPCVTTASYAITGQVKYENVDGAGFLEMWNHFPDGGMYFSRTLGDSGPMQSLTSSSGWRPFTLPFYIGEAKIRPSKLEFNVVLPGRGTVYLGPLKLVQFEKGESAIAGRGYNTNGWWTNRTAGIVGGIVGSVLGLIGAAIGTLAGMGVARKVCLSLLVLMFVFGIASLVLAIAAFAYSQPYAVYYPPLLMSVICLPLAAILFFPIKRGYEYRELRKMHAMDMK
jgi:hypothetical protein